MISHVAKISVHSLVQTIYKHSKCTQTKNMMSLVQQYNYLTVSDIHISCYCYNVVFLTQFILINNIVLDRKSNIYEASIVYRTYIYYMYSLV